MRLLTTLVWAIVPLLTLGGAWAQDGAAAPGSVILTTFRGEDGLTLEQVAAGVPGEGVLLFYRADRDPEHPSLVVRFGRSLTGTAVADVFAVPPGMDHVPLDIGPFLRVGADLIPGITLEALGGWWVRDGKTNYNLDVIVRADIYAIWAARLFEHPELAITPERTTASIQVRDPEGEGVPLWDLRQLVPPFSGRGFTRTAYAERKCHTPLVLEPGIVPLWPFVASPTDQTRRLLQQTPGRLVPPILVDWSTGQLTTFSELVTVRGQNCSYAMYSLLPLVEGEEPQEGNFETPFAFYDLSGEGVGQPNLIIRTERFPASDEWSTGMDLYDVQLHRRPVPRDTNNVRYAWRAAVGDGTWDYAVQVLGFHPYDFATPIAGGFATITAPPYEAYPEWVIGQSWPAVNFVDSTEGRYESTEGIYEWNAKVLGLGYAFGWERSPHLEGFDTIRAGQRGEYRYLTAGPPELYFSPVDNRLHLVGAEGGLWNLGNGWEVRVANLARDAYIDRWELVPGDDADPGEQQPGTLMNLLGHQFLLQGGSLTIQRSEVPSELLRITPPTDTASWRSFIDRLAPFEGTARDPLRFGAWLDALGGPRLRLPGVELSDVRVSGSSLRFVLTAAQPTGASGSLSIPALQELPAGRFVVTYDQPSQSWTREVATPAALEVELRKPALRALFPAALELSLANVGSSDWVGEAQLSIGDDVVERWETLRVPGNAAVEETVLWVPEGPGARDVVLTMGERSYPLGQLDVTAPESMVGRSAFDLPGGSRVLPFVLLALVTLVALAGLWRGWSSMWS